MTAEQFTESCTDHGEGPLWDARSPQLGGNRLLLVDMIKGDLVQLDGSGSHRRTHVADVAACLRHRASGGYVLATEHGFQTLDDQLVPVGPALSAFGNSAIRMNDGGCDPQGRFYCGTMAYDETPGAGSLYRLDPGALEEGGPVPTVLTGVTISNGLQWSADGSLVFYNDTPTRRITVFDFDADAGSMINSRPFVTLPDDETGAPDGMAIDTEGGIWIALWGGSAVHRYDPAGKLDLVIELPVSNVSACTFGGDDLGTLYITTSRQGLSDDDQPQAGSVFTARPGVTGAVPYPFAG
ncbi:SMP-30/gluconolactonase/LRE family protein [Microlunatus elymi]|uniref:SMP-30/gluconolactonase/LRE family protein n=1 Tax=Microlunatus elymi TaxID=2596828 RepID=A0A516Q660_9ACTN|nr:SMP-30/gluconolactonase/LRE family protein [Microlunatus elymi]